MAALSYRIVFAACVAASLVVAVTVRMRLRICGRYGAHTCVFFSRVLFSHEMNMYVLYTYTGTVLFTAVCVRVLDRMYSTIYV